MLQSPGKGIPLNSRFIEKNLSNISGFDGCFPANCIPDQLAKRTNFSIVCNLSRVGYEGTHFVTIIGCADYIIYIDSVGIPCISEDIRTFLKKTNREILYNKKQIQHLDSIYCSMYCIFFILHFNLSHIIKCNVKFSDAKLLNNDVLVMKYVKHYMRKNI
jgi:uncharacterized protein YutD